MRIFSLGVATLVVGIAACAPESTTSEPVGQPDPAPQEVVKTPEILENPEIVALGGQAAVCDVAHKAYSVANEGAIDPATCEITIVDGYPTIGFTGIDAASLPTAKLGDVFDLATLSSPGSNSEVGESGGYVNVAALYVVEAAEATPVCVGVTATAKDGSSNSIFVYSSNMEEPATFGLPVSETGAQETALLNRPVVRPGEKRVVAVLPREPGTELFELRFDNCRG